MLTRRLATIVAVGLLLWGFCEAMARVSIQGQLLVVLVAPTALGLVAYVALRKDTWRDAWLVAVAATAPLFPILAMGGDPAKPGLQWLFYWPMFIAIAVGAFIAWFMDVYVINRTRSPNAQA